MKVGVDETKAADIIDIQNASCPNKNSFFGYFHGNECTDVSDAFVFNP
jgi:hypothetical protein